MNNICLFTISTVIDNLLFYLHPRTIAKITILNKCTKESIDHYRIINSSIENRLKEFNLDKDILGDLLEDYNGCLSGHLILQTLLGERYNCYCIDIYLGNHDKDTSILINYIESKKYKKVIKSKYISSQ